MTESYEAHSSHVRVYRECAREFWFSQQPEAPGAPPKPPPTVAQQRGTVVHGELEIWLKGGPDPEDPAALACVPILAGLDWTTALSEREFAVNASGVPYVGRIDFVSLRDPKLPKVWDFKTLWSMGYARSAAEILGDVQLNAYAHYVLTFKVPQAERIELAWLFTQTGDGSSSAKWGTGAGTRPDVRLVSLVVTRASVRAQWAGAVQSARDMVRTLRLPLAEVPGNPGRCLEGRGAAGCPYIDACDVGLAAQEGEAA